MSERLFQRLWGAACLWIIVAAFWRPAWWVGLPPAPVFVYGLLRPRPRPEHLGPTPTRTRVLRVVLPLTLAGLISGVWLLGTLLPKINAAWLFLAFIAGFTVGALTLGAIIHPLLKEESHEIPSPLCTRKRDR